MITHLCQPRRVSSYAACEAEAAISAEFCDGGFKFYNKTSVCDLRESTSAVSSHSKTRDALDRCVRARRKIALSKAGGASGSGGVAIVESMTENMFKSPGVPLKEEIRRTTHNIGCWAARHNYSLVLNGVNASELRGGYSRPYGPRRLWNGVPFDKINDVRHRVVGRLLDRYDAVLHIDTDTIALNENRSLRRYLHHPAKLTFQMREIGEVAAATYLARQSPETSCFLQLWDELGHLSHRNPRPMLNTDNGVLLMLIARLLDESAAKECETDAVLARGLHGASKDAAASVGGTDETTTKEKGRRAHSRLLHTPGQSLRPGKDLYLESYVPCFASRITPSILLHRLQRTVHLPWLRFLFPREGFHRSLESPADEKQHPSLTSLQPRSDVLGHGWKSMGRLMVPPGNTCTPLQVRRSGCPRLSPRNESALAIKMCWWLHHAYGAAAFRACSTRVRHTSSSGATASQRYLLRYKRLGFGGGGRGLVIYTHTINLSEPDVRSLFPEINHSYPPHGRHVVGIGVHGRRKSDLSGAQLAGEWALPRPRPSRAGHIHGRSHR